MATRGKQMGSGKQVEPVETVEPSDSQAAEEVVSLSGSPDPNAALVAMIQMLQETLSPERQAKAQVDAQKRENRTNPGISPLNPQGDKDYPRPVLPYRKLHIPHETEAEQLSYEELELVSRIQPGEYSITRHDDTTVPIAVHIERNATNGEPETLTISHNFAYREDQKMLMPKLSNMLRGILSQAGVDSSDILTIDERRRAVKSGELPISVGA